MCFFASVLCCLIVMLDYPNMHVTGTSSSTRRVREAGHASDRRERTQWMEEEGVVASRRQPQEAMDVQQQQLEEEEFLKEHEAMEEDMEDAKPH